MEEFNQKICNNNQHNAKRISNTGASMYIPRKTGKLLTASWRLHFFRHKTCGDVNGDGSKVHQIVVRWFWSEDWNGWVSEIFMILLYAGSNKKLDNSLPGSFNPLDSKNYSCFSIDSSTSIYIIDFWMAKMMHIAHDQ